MSIIIDEVEVNALKEAGKRHAHILLELEKAVVVGITTGELNDVAEKIVKEYGDKPAFKGYQPDGAAYPFPATVCTSVNDEVVHGIPGSRVLETGDIVGLDFGIIHKGLITDAAVTVAVGEISKKTQKLMDVTKQALYAGIDAAIIGNRVGDIGAAIESVVHSNSLYNYGEIPELGGHGVGRHVHEEPYIPNYGTKGKGEILKEGMVLALEPMFTLGRGDILLDDDGYTIRTVDGSVSAHFEHTIRITKNGTEIITAL